MVRDDELLGRTGEGGGMRGGCDVRSRRRDARCDDDDGRETSKRKRGGGHVCAARNASDALLLRGNADPSLGMATHRHRRRGLRVGVVLMRRHGTRRGHHHRVRHGMLHCSKITISHHWLSCGHQVIRDWRTLRALVVVIGMRVRWDRGRGH